MCTLKKESDRQQRRRPYQRPDERSEAKSKSEVKSLHKTGKGKSPHNWWTKEFLKGIISSSTEITHADPMKSLLNAQRLEDHDYILNEYMSKHCHNWKVWVFMVDHDFKVFSGARVFGVASKRGELSVARPCFYWNPPGCHQGVSVYVVKIEKMEYGGSQAYGVAHNLKATQERQSVGGAVGLGRRWYSS